MQAEPRHTPARQSRSPLPLIIGAVLIAAGAGTAAWWWTQRTPQAPVQASVTASVPAPTTAPAPPPIVHPVEQAPAAPSEPAPVPLPALGESDPTVFEGLAVLLTDDAWRKLLAGDFLIQRFVATIDNLPRRKLAPHLLPVRPAAGTLKVVGSSADAAIAPANAARYAPYLTVMDAVDSRRLVALYLRLYPLFQQAYHELGGPEAYFNDRLVEVIDHLLAAPTPDTPPRLVQPKVFWEFADPELEQRSAGEKLLIRLGPADAARVKAKLAEIRALLVAAPA
jgi:hypothetical protein